MVQQFGWKRFSIDQPPSEAEALHWACWNRQPAAVRAALAGGADPNGRSSTGSPPLLTLTLATKVRGFRIGCSPVCMLAVYTRRVGYGSRRGLERCMLGHRQHDAQRSPTPADGSLACCIQQVARREPEPVVVSIVLQLLAAGADVNGGDRRG